MTQIEPYAHLGYTPVPDEALRPGDYNLKIARHLERHVPKVPGEHRLLTTRNIVNGEVVAEVTWCWDCGTGLGPGCHVESHASAHEYPASVNYANATGEWSPHHPRMATDPALATDKRLTVGEWPTP